MLVMPIALGLQWLRTRKFNRIYAASTALVLVFGALTLAFRNPTFLFWKPTVLNWAFAAVFLGSQYIGDKSVIERMLGGAAELKPAQWIRLNLAWVLFFVFVGALNLYVAYSYSEAFWVKFKLFGMLGITVIFVILQSVWLTLIARENEPAANDSGQ